MKKAIVVILLFTLLGCEAHFPSFDAPRSVPPELRQNVGLYVHTKPERINYYGSAADDVSDFLAFHLQQTLPFQMQSALLEIFPKVETAEEGVYPPRFESRDLEGYFELRIERVRYDYPDASYTHFRAEVRLALAFKDIQHNVIWSKLFEGHGLGFSDENIRLTDFGKGVSLALEDAFQEAVDETAEGVLDSPLLRTHFKAVEREKQQSSQF